MGEVEFFEDLGSAVEELFNKIGGDAALGVVDPEVEAVCNGGEGVDEAGWIDVTCDVEDPHPLACMMGLSEGEIAQDPLVKSGSVGRNLGFKPPLPGAGQRFSHPGGSDVAGLDIEDIGFCLGDHEAEEAGACAVLREGELHFIAVMPDFRGGEDREDRGVWKGGLNAPLFFGELLSVVHLLPGAAATGIDVGAAGGHAMGRGGKNLEEAPFMGSFFLEFELG